MRNLWEGWKRIARKIGDFQARIILTLFYFFVVGPFALLLQWRTDPLALKPGTPRGWQPKADENDPPMMRAIKQF
jgi:hypothetical protein